MSTHDISWDQKMKIIVEQPKTIQIPFKSKISGSMLLDKFSDTLRIYVISTDSVYLET